MIHHSQPAIWIRTVTTWGKRQYTQLTQMVKDSIDKEVSAKTWTKTNDRIVSVETKALREERAQQYQKNKSNQATRKKWNRKIRTLCIKDYKCIERG